MSGTMKMTTEPNGMMRLTLPDGQVVDLNRKIRLTKSEATTSGHGFTCEGALSDGIDASSEYGGPMVFHLSFFGGVKADWCPYLGDTIENVE